jgi:hypothetical protein
VAGVADRKPDVPAGRKPGMAAPILFPHGLLGDGEGQVAAAVRMASAALVARFMIT